MPQRVVNVNIIDWKTGEVFSGRTVEFISVSPNPAYFPQVLTLQVKDSENDEWIDVPDYLSANGFIVDPTPVGVIVKNNNVGKIELTATFSLVANNHGSG